MRRTLSKLSRLLPCILVGVILLTQPYRVSGLEHIMQARTITGRVISSDDQQGFPGVNILVKGSTTGTVTDAEGNYSIEVPSGEAVLVYSAIGYATAERLVGVQSAIDITLEVDVTSLAEVVVVGYGTVKKSDITGALSRVTAETLEERPVPNVLQALQGQAAGVNVSSNMRPGELPNVTIRGNHSINGPTGPLYVVDGIPLITAPNSLNSPASLNDINPNDIASVEILKDASATAIYGSRGANGVVLITTKKGSQGKVSINYNATVSLDSYKSLTNWMDGGEYFDRWRLALMNGRLYQTTTNTSLDQPADIWYPDPVLDRTKIPGLNSDPRAIEALMAGYEWEDYGAGIVAMRPTTQAEKDLGWPDEVPIYNSDNVKNYNWEKDAVRQGVTQNHQISLSSGTEQSKVYLSLGYLNQVGVQKDQDFERFNALLSGEVTPTKWFTLGTSINTAFSVQNFGIHAPNTSNTGAKDLYSRAMAQFPFLSPTDDNGNDVRSPQLNINLWNPLIDIDQSINERRSTSLLGNMFAEIKFMPWLKYRINFGAQYRDFRRGAWTGPLATAHLGGRPNTSSYNDEETFSWVVENLLYFDKTFATDHVVGVTLLQSAQKFRTENVGAGSINNVNELAYWYDLGANTLGRANTYGSGYSENTLMSFMARANYAYKDKYLLTASARYDGASVLAPGNKWDFFSSFALAWKMHEENFMSGLGWLDEFKPRLGYGVVGNSSIEPYTSSGPLSRNMYAFGSTAAAGYLPQIVRNPDLSWERTAQWNAGIDFAALKGRVSGSVELYKANTTGLLFPRILPGVTGYVEKWENIGEIQNKGVEITLSGVAVQRSDFSWTVDVNWSSNREEILELMNGKQDIIPSALFIGEPTQVYYQLDHDGIWTNSAEDMEEMAKFRANGFNYFPGTVKVVDQITVDTDGDGVKDARDYRITGDDYVVRGTNRPKWTGGITNTFRYKNWELSSFIYTRVGQTYFGGYPNSYGGTNPNGRVENDVWSFTNQDGRWPMPNASTGISNVTSAMQYNNGSFAIVRNISLSYSVPSEFLSKIFLKNLQLNVQVLNPFFLYGGDVVKLGLNPDDNTNWDVASQANTITASPLGGMNTNTVLSQSWVFGLRAGF
ncbi:MAG TPA: TonB-dependent receptor [Ohtaekwangia sp.]